ncbi:MAG TPA: pyridoxal-phosphate dependent enzyme [Candidatus Dormibacteraeota bacterium]|jgi:threonine dehydratase|nr:pyridoxal-phosphate dependent enzyme [Candidatus Dormibacteraeota bacterium]
MKVAAPALQRVSDAATLVAPHVRRTPLIPVDGGHLKLESLQPTGSFKVRGFFNAALSADPQRRAAGLMTVSAGNAALACAHVAQHLRIACRVVMFDSAPKAKRDGVERLGATVIPMPFAEMLDWIRNQGWESEPELFIHPFADEAVIAGHGTLALELVEQCPEVRRVIVPVGGGGLITGVAATIKALRPDVEVVGVQSDGYALWRDAFSAGGAVSLQPATIADGTTAPFNPAMFELLAEHVDRWITVPESRVRSAVAELAVRAKIAAEGAGALAYAALGMLDARPESVAVVSGGNIDPARVAELLTEYAAAG